MVIYHKKSEFQITFLNFFAKFFFLYILPIEIKWIMYITINCKWVITAEFYGKMVTIIKYSIICNMLKISRIKINK